MSNILLIHMGLPKTGTTSLQFLLHRNRERLMKYGWDYPDLQKELFDLSIWTEDFVKNGIFYQEERKIKDGVMYKKSGDLNIDTEDWERIWEQILIHLQSNHVVISEESLWFDAERFLEGARQKYDNIKVIVYLRRQDRAVESWWNQSVKGRGHCTETLKEFIESSPRMRRMDGFHYLKKLDQVSRIIGKENLIVRVFEKQQFVGDHGLESDFLSVLGIEADWAEWEDSYIQNAGLSGNYIEIKRIFNFMQPEEYINSDMGPLEWEFVKLSQESGKEGGIFTDEERRAFLEQFRSENEKIARDFLHRENGSLFYDDRMEYPLNTVCQHTSFDEDMIRVFSSMIGMQNKAIRGLKDYSCTLAEKLLLQKVRKRKIMLFGAGRRCADLLNYLKLPAVLIADNNGEKSGRNIRGIKIICAKDVENWSEFFVIVTCAETGEIEDQLTMLGLEKEEDYVLAKEYFKF